MIKGNGYEKKESNLLFYKFSQRYGIEIKRYRGEPTEKRRIELKKRKILFSFMAFILIGLVLFIYDQFNGNPVSKYLATKKLERYLKDTYPDKELRIERGAYNFKDQEYSFQVLEKGSVRYFFGVKGYWPEVYRDGIYEANLDTELMEKIGKEAEEEIQALLAKDVKTLHSVYVYVEFLKGTFPPDTHWNKSMKLEKPIKMHIYLNATHATKEQIFEDTKKIQTILNQNGYNYERVNINANVIGDPKLSGKDIQGQDIGYLKYGIHFTKDEELKIKNMREFNQ